MEAFYKRLNKKHCSEMELYHSIKCSENYTETVDNLAEGVLGSPAVGSVSEPYSESIKYILSYAGPYASSKPSDKSVD